MSLTFVFCYTPFFVLAARQNKTLEKILKGFRFLKFNYSGLLGITKAAIIYAKRPQPAKKSAKTKIKRTTVESMFKYSAIPPQTPQSFLSVFDLYNFFSIVFLPSRFTYLIYHKFKNLTRFLASFLGFLCCQVHIYNIVTQVN